MNKEDAVERRAWWAEHVAAWQDSDLTQADFCKTRQLNYNNFNYWAVRLRRAAVRAKELAEASRHVSEAPLLIPVQVGAPSTSITTVAPAPRPLPAPSGPAVVLRIKRAGLELEGGMLPSAVWCAELLRALS